LERFDARRRWSGEQEAPTLSQATMLAVPGLGRQHAEIDADLAQRLGVFVLGILPEDQLKVGGAVQPAILVDLGLELARCPARIAECKHCALWTIAARDRLEDIEGGGEADALVDWQRGVLDEEIARVQHEAAAGLDWAALEYFHAAGAGRKLDQLGGAD